MANPQANAQPTISVTDSLGARVNATWAITVTTTGFKFLDSVNGSTGGNGSMNSPWRNLIDAYNNAGANDFLVFRSGTYTTTSIPRIGVGGPWEGVEWQGAMVWLAYPGTQPTIDFGYRPGSDNGTMIRFGGNNTYVDNFLTDNTRVIGFQFDTGNNATFRRLRMRNLLVGGDGTNAAFIMTITYPNPSRFMVIQDCEFANVANNSVTLKIYAQEKMLIEDTIHHDAMVAIELKDDVRRFTVRGNTLYNISVTAIGGNMQETGTHGEILFNYSRAQIALDMNQNGMAGPIHAYRNTLIGRVRVRNTDSADGPFTIYNNVIVSDDAGTPSGSHVFLENVSAPNRVNVSNNLAGYPSDNLVDGNGYLTSGYASYVSTHGYQSRTGTTTPPPPTTTAPQPPTNLRVIR